MSAVAGAPPIAPGRGTHPSGTSEEKQGMSQGRKVLYWFLGVWLGGIVLFVILFGVTAHKAPAVASSVFSPTDEFKLDTWFKLGPIAFNKGVLYLLMQHGLSELKGIGLVTWGSMNSFTLTAIPLFILMAELMQRSGLSFRIYRGLAKVVSRLPGGLLQTNIVGCALFASISGSSVRRSKKKK